MPDTFQAIEPKNHSERRKDLPLNIKKIMEVYFDSLESGNFSNFRKDEKAREDVCSLLRSNQLMPEDPAQLEAVLTLLLDPSSSKERKEDDRARSRDEFIENLKEKEEEARHFCEENRHLPPVVKMIELAGSVYHEVARVLTHMCIIFDLLEDPAITLLHVFRQIAPFILDENNTACFKEGTPGFDKDSPFVSKRVDNLFFIYEPSYSFCRPSIAHAFLNVIELETDHKIKSEDQLLEALGYPDDEFNLRLAERILTISFQCRYEMSLDRMLREGKKYDDLLKAKPQEFNLPNRWIGTHDGEEVTQEKMIKHSINWHFRLNEEFAENRVSIRRVAEVLGAPYSFVLQAQNFL